MAITGITTTADNGVERITDSQITTGTVDGEVVVLDNSNSRLSADSATGIIITNSTIRLDSDITSSNTSSAPLTYVGAGSNTTNKIRFIDSMIIGGSFTSRKNIHISELTDSKVIETDNTGQLFCYTQSGSVLNNAVFDGINVWEVNGTPPSIASGIVVRNCNYGYLRWSGGRIDFLGFAVENIAIADAWINAGEAHHWNNDPSFDNTRLRLRLSFSRYFDGRIMAWNFLDRDSGLNVDDALLIFRDDFNGLTTDPTTSERARFTTNSNGLLSGTYDSQNRVNGADQERDVLFVYKNLANQAGSDHSAGGGITYSIDEVTSEIEVRSYAHEAPSGYIEGDIFTLNEQGSLNADYSVKEYQNFILNPDSSITELDTAIVAGYTSFDPQKLYDRHKLEWRNVDSVTLINRVGQLIELGSFNIVIDPTSSGYDLSGLTITIQEGNYIGDFSGTGTVTYQNGSLINGSTISNDIVYSSGSGTTITGLIATGTLDFTVAGTYWINSCDINEVTNSSGGNVTLNLLDGATVTTVTGPNIEINQEITQITFNNLTNSNLEIFDSSFSSRQRYENLTGTQVYNVPTGSSGVWYYVINRQGYSPITASFNAESSTLNIDATMREVTQPSGASMYTGSSNPILTVEVLPDHP